MVKARAAGAASKTKPKAAASTARRRDEDGGKCFMTTSRDVKRRRMRGQYGRTAAKANSRTLVQRGRPAGNLQQINVSKYGFNQKAAFDAAFLRDRPETISSPNWRAFCFLSWRWPALRR
jgi:hypothetical protein